MGFLDNLFGRKHKDKEPGMEDFMTLIRVYFQASIATNVGITNLAMLPDLRVFKSTLKIATVNNKLGVGERTRCRKMLADMYGLEDDFYKEIDQSVKKNCRKMQDVQVYFVQFQTFTQELMMLLGNIMKFRLRLPSFFKGTLRTMTEKTVNDIFNKNDYDNPATMKTVMDLRALSKRLGFSEQWVADFAYQLIMLAKKEPAAQEK